MKKKLIIVLVLLGIILLGNVYTYSTTNHEKKLEIQYKETKKNQVIFDYNVYNYHTLLFTIDYYKDNKKVGCEYMDIGVTFGDIKNIRRYNPFTIANELTHTVHDYGTITLMCAPEESPFFLVAHGESDKDDYSTDSSAQVPLENIQEIKGFEKADMTKFTYVEGSCKDNVLAEMEYKNLKYTLRYFASVEERMEYKTGVRQ